MYGNSYSTGGDLGSGFFAAFFGFSIFFGIAYYVFFGIAGTILFKKAGYKNPWAAWVPIYQNYALLEIGGQRGGFALLPIAGLVLQVIPVLGQIASFLLSIVTLVATIYAYVGINKAFRKDTTTWTILAVLLPPVWLGILAWNKEPYQKENVNGPEFLPTVLPNLTRNTFIGSPANTYGSYSQQPQAPYQAPQGTQDQSGYNPNSQSPYGPNGGVTPPAAPPAPPAAPQNPYNPYNGNQPPQQ